MPNQITVAAPSAPSVVAQSRSIVSRKSGKTLGTRFTFSGERSAKEVKEALQAADPKLKGNQLSIAANKVLCGTTDVAWATFGVWVSGVRSKGFQPDVADLKARSASARFIKPGDSVPTITAEDVAKMTPEKKAELLKALGVEPQPEAPKEPVIDLPKVEAPAIDITPAPEVPAAE